MIRCHAITGAGMLIAGMLLTGCAPEAVGNAPYPDAVSSPIGFPADIATGLDVPWDIAALPDGSALLTLRDEARILRLAGTTVTSLATGEPDDTLAGVVPGASTGLRGIAISPTFSDDGHVFVYYSTVDDDRVVRFTLTGDRLSDPQPIITGIPNAGAHTGGRIRIGPDGMLYVGTGDAGGAQDRTALDGKFLRVTLDGQIPDDNPFKESATWSYGHRNPQGFDWDKSRRMFASEFGQNSQDELNEITAAGNYGWPLVEGDTTDPAYVAPLHTWAPSEASPSGVAVTDHAIYLAALRGQKLWRVPLDADGTTGDAAPYLDGVLGRLRAVEVSPDGDALWVLTNNTHGGTPRDGDDRVLAVPLT